MKQAKNSKLHKSKNRVIFGFIASLLLLCAASSLLYAKYYAGSNDKGVATASGLYFTSNVLKNIETENVGDYPVIYNTTTWDGTGDCELEVQLRNYQNQLLYNDRNLDITYQVNFKLMGQTDGGVYTVTYNNSSNNQTETKEITAEGVTVSGMQLKGGKANAQQFMVNVKRPESEKDNSNYRSVGIIVTAVPVSPSFVANTSKLCGVLYATMVSTNYELLHEFGQVFDPLKNYSGFPYTITYMPGEDNLAHNVKITWDNSLEIDQFSNYYKQALEEGKASVDNTGKKYIILTMQPYSSVSITFYRSHDFSAANKAALENLVTVEDISQVLAEEGAP